MAEQKIGIEFTGDARDFIAAAKQVNTQLAAVEKSIREVAQKVDAGTSNMRGSFQGLAGTTQSVEKSIREVGRKVEASNRKMRESFQGLAGSVQSFGQGIAGAVIGFGGAAAAGAVLVGAFRDLNRELGQFETQIANVNTLLGEGSPPIEKFREGIQKLAVESGKTTVELTQGLYDAISSGIPATLEAGGALDFVNQAQRAATAGLGTTKDAVNALATVFNTYGQKAGTTAQVSDKFFRVIADGVVTFPLLAGNIGEVAGTADAMGVKFDEMAAAVAQVSKIFPNSAETFTAVRDVIQSVGAPTIDVAKRFAALGIEVGESALKSKGLAGVLADIVEKTGGNKQAMRALIPEVKGLMAALVLGKDAGKPFAEEIERVGKAAGDTTRALDKMDETLGRKWDKAAEAIKGAFAPAIETLRELTGSLLDWMGGVEKATKLGRRHQLGGFKYRTAGEVAFGEATVGRHGTEIGQLATMSGIPAPAGLTTAIEAAERFNTIRRRDEINREARANVPGLFGVLEAPGSVPYMLASEPLSEAEKERRGKWAIQKEADARKRGRKEKPRPFASGGTQFGPFQPEDLVNFYRPPTTALTGPLTIEQPTMDMIDAAAQQRIAEQEAEMSPFLEAISTAREYLVAFGSALYDVAGAAIGYAGRGAEGVAALKADADAALLFVQNVAKYLPQIFDALLPMIEKIAIALGDAIPIVAATLAEKMPLVVKALMAQVPRIVDALIVALPDLVTAVVASLPYVIEALIYTTAAKLPAFISTVVGQVVPAITARIPEIIGAIAKGVYEALKEVLGKLNPVGEDGPIAGALNTFGAVDMAKWALDPLDIFPWNRGGVVGDIRRFANGGLATALRPPDIVPAALQPGEFVVRRDAAMRNKDALKQLNAGGTLGGNVSVNMQARFGTRDLGALLSRLLVVEVQRDGVPVRSVGQIASPRVRNYPSAQAYLAR